VDVLLTIEFDQNNLVDRELFELTFSDIVRDFWNSKAYTIVISIILSTIIPILKCIILILFWTKYLKISKIKRWRILFIIDLLGHIFIANLVFISYFILILNNNIEISKNFNIMINSIIPIKNIICTSLSSIILQIVGQLFLEFAVYDFSQLDYKKKMELKKKKIVSDYKKLFIFNIILVIGFLYFYSFIFIESICEFNVGGALGDFISKKKFTLWELIVNLGDLESINNSFMIISIIIFLVTIIFPVLFVILCIIFWIIPINYMFTINFMCKVLRILFSWSALDFLILGALGGIFEINRVSQYIIKRDFQYLCSLLTHFSNKKDCITIDATINLGGKYLSIGIFIFVIIFILNYNIFLRLQIINIENIEKEHDNKTEKKKIIGLNIHF